MKNLQKILILSIIVILTWSCEKHDSIKVNDNDFLKSLLKQGIDKDGDGKISPAEAESVVSLHIDNAAITDLTGIEAFINLDTLFCHDNNLTSLNVSNLLNLVYLSCEFNNISSIDVSKNIKLKFLACSYNP